MANCLGAERQAAQQQAVDARALLMTRLASVRTSSWVADRGAPVGRDGAIRSAWEWLRFEGVTIEQIAPDAVAGIDPAVVTEVIQDARYAPYLERQAEEVTRLRADEEILLPDIIDYHVIPGLSSEMVLRLTASRPRSLAAAARVQGVTPAALSAVLLHTKRRLA